MHEESTKEVRNFSTSSSGSNCVCTGAGQDIVVFFSGQTKQGLGVQPASSKKAQRAAPSASQEDWNMDIAFMDMCMGPLTSAAALPVPADYGADQG